MRRMVTAVTVALTLTLDAAAPKVLADARAQYAQLKALAGTWDAPLPRNEVMRNIFRPIAFGTAVLHEEWKGGEQLTATVFYLVGLELRADHYCDMGNQLHYVARPSDAARVLDFELKGGTNLDTHPRHFHSTRWELIDDSRHVQDWVIAIPGKPMQSVRMEFMRVPDPGAAAPVAEPEAVVRAYIHALTTADAQRWLALFSPDAKVFDVPTEADRLVGKLSGTMGTNEQREFLSKAMLAQRPLTRFELTDLAVAGDIVAAKVRIIPTTSGGRPSHELALYRVRDGLIQDVWQLGRASADPTPSSQEAEDVVARLTAANNSGDVETFLALFSPTAKNFRNTGDPHTLGDKPSVKVFDAKSRRDTYVAMFAKGAPAQVDTIATVALGDMVVARDVAYLPDGKVTDGMSVYRISRGLIERDWYVFERRRF